MPVDPDKRARQLARQEKQLKAEEERREEAAQHAEQQRLRADIRRLAAQALSVLAAQDYQGMTDVRMNAGRSAITYKPRKAKPVAGWEICQIEFPQFDGVARRTVWLLANGDFATTFAGSKYGGDRHGPDDLFLGGFLTEIRDGMRDLVTRLQADSH